MEKMGKAKAVNYLLRDKPELKTFYTDQFPGLCNFRVCDAAKPDE